MEVKGKEGLEESGKQETVMSDIKKVAFDEFLKEVNPECVEDVLNMAKKTGATGLVLFRNVNNTTKDFGNSTIVALGPTRTYKTIEDIGDGHLMASSVKQSPLMWCEFVGG